MSHVATVELEVKDLECLARAATRLGLEFREGQQTYHWWGQHVGDYPVPEGFTVEDLGHCEHAIGWPGIDHGGKNYLNGDSGFGDSTHYEIGVRRRRDAHGRELPGYVLLWDFMDQKLVTQIGENGNQLKQAYAVEVALKQARLQGFSSHAVQRADGSVRLVLGKQF